MDSAPSKAFLLVQLLLLLSCFQEASCFFPDPPVHPPTQHHHHYHHHAPGHPPVYPPFHAPSPHHSHPLIPAPALTPSHPPAHAPFKPPFHHPPSPRSFIAVQGVVYCTSCKDTFYQPIFGAKVKLLCKNTKYSLSETTKTDKNGYFFLQAPKTVTSFASHKCKVFLVSSPIPSCSRPSNLNASIVVECYRGSSFHESLVLICDRSTLSLQ
ncbi:hypothetical protein BT93_L4340 [Corymbia citriodora subsp. variegata]|uniref:Uncharacterized protein n=1 Tax=Corymbia citriodora subsp. variegata TaxID=360336 RepID=A0A8T0CYQ0_CORYI|nr:hypothetical protein BT93_L4340 [Corymbia citriodora subsp. variegata]